MRRLLLLTLLLTACDDGSGASSMQVGPSDALAPDVFRGDPRPDGSATLPDVSFVGQVPVAVDTVLGAETTAAGVVNRVTCTVIDENGDPRPAGETRLEVFPDNGFDAVEAGLRGERAGEYIVRCVAPELGLRDLEPAVWTVGPGPAARVQTTLSTTQIPVDGLVDVTCAAFDDFGNPTAATDLSIDIEPLPAEFAWQNPTTAKIRSAGRYDLTCRVPGAFSLLGEALHVVPGAPVRLVGRLDPDRAFYRVGQIVTYDVVALDAFDNPIPAVEPRFSAAPFLPNFGLGRYTLREEGEYELVARHEEIILSTPIVVTAGGPQLECTSPAFGAQLGLPEMQTVRGRVTGVAGLREVRVDGRRVEVGADGRWSVQKRPEFGINAVEVVATDDAGGENSSFCTWFASRSYASEGARLNGAVLLRLGESAVDGGSPNNPIRSLGDILRRVLNSDGLRDTLHNALVAQNPLVPTACRQRVGPVCVFSFGLQYRDLEIDGPHSLDIELVDGGINVDATIRNLEITGLLRGTLGNQGTIFVDRVRAELTFDVGLRNGQPTVSLRRVDRLELGSLRSDFSGLITGAILELVFRAVDALFRDVLLDRARDFLVDRVDDLIGDFLGSVDLGALGLGFDVPKPVGGTVRLSLDGALSGVDVNRSRIELALSTRFDGNDRLNTNSRGVPRPPGSISAPVTTDVSAAVALVTLNQALHQLWRSGWFEAAFQDLDDRFTSALPDGASVRLSLARAPAVSGVAGQTALVASIGPATLRIVYPGLFEDRITVVAAARVRAGVRLRGARDLVFEGLQVEDLWLGVEGAVVSGEARDVLEDAVSEILQSLVNRFLNDALPELPIPEFAIPANLGAFDLPAGRGVGLRDPDLDGGSAAWTVRGRFGE